MIARGGRPVGGKGASDLNFLNDGTAHILVTAADKEKNLLRQMLGEFFSSGG